MSKVCIFLAPGFEECEALLPIDLLRRAKVSVTTVSINGERVVTGGRGVPMIVDCLAEEVDLTGFDLIILPGGSIGTQNLKDSKLVAGALMKQYEAGKRIAAICAAPSVLGGLGLLQGRHATSYPDFRPQLTGAILTDGPVVVDGPITTSVGMGTAMQFGLELARQLCGDDTARALAEEIQLPQ